MTDINEALRNDDWPTLKAELGRKGMQALQKYVAKHTDGRITDRELYIVTDVLWDVMSGLSPEADLRIVEAVNEELRRNAKARRAAKHRV
ncbi:hypothetical protein [Mesorhizobium sp.]|uniref:hypothetical protein n=1 Tax=Mesorhizobium sp. TaxID=1871066 RepID=UPI000FE4EE63|nr:hypothetical protein [Mesorhizobium sp.]RWI35496.1 MAG: hypothetical protein EOR14_28755 [Mesorhizobium sp.]RWJ66335.1 MAG: hypothetical protein EOR34_28380 [Mesorhizobium sp.]